MHIHNNGIEQFEVVQSLERQQRCQIVVIEKLILAQSEIQERIFRDFFQQFSSVPFPQENSSLPFLRVIINDINHDL